MKDPMIREKKVALEEIGAKVQIIKNQRKDGTLGSPWLLAKWDYKNCPLAKILRTSKSIAQIIPEYNSITIEYCPSTDHTEIKTSWHPHFLEWPTSDSDITSCYIKCPQVGDAE